MPAGAPPPPSTHRGGHVQNRIRHGPFRRTAIGTWWYRLRSASGGLAQEPACFCSLDVRAARWVVLDCLILLVGALWPMAVTVSRDANLFVVFWVQHLAVVRELPSPCPSQPLGVSRSQHQCCRSFIVRGERRLSVDLQTAVLSPCIEHMCVRMHVASAEHEA